VRSRCVPDCTPLAVARWTQLRSNSPDVRDVSTSASGSLPSGNGPSRQTVLRARTKRTRQLSAFARRALPARAVGDRSLRSTGLGATRMRKACHQLDPGLLAGRASVGAFAIEVMSRSVCAASASAATGAYVVTGSLLAVRELVGQSDKCELVRDWIFVERCDRLVVRPGQPVLLLDLLSVPGLNVARAGGECGGDSQSQRECGECFTISLPLMVAHIGATRDDKPHVIRTSCST
jgi:hypothetical protein